MNTGRYKSIDSNNDTPYKGGGYLRAWLSLLTDFVAIEKPILSNTPVIGEAYTINTTHEWKTAKEPIEIFIKKDSLECDSDTVGDIGGGSIVYKPKFIILGDGAVVDEIVFNILNEDFVVFVLEDAINTVYVQFGDKNYPCVVDKLSMKSGNIVGGGKGTCLEFRSFSKFFYKGIIPTEGAIQDIIFGALTDNNFDFIIDNNGTILNFSV